MMKSIKLAMLLSLATLFTPAFAQGPNPAVPGTLNYVEGHVSIEGRAVQPRQIGGVALHAGEMLATSDGHVEMLLTPGVFLRLDHDSTIKMVTPDLTKTEVELSRGRADLEVDALYKQNDLLIDLGPSQTKILKVGLYRFDAADGQLKVFTGKAAVSPAPNGPKWIDVKEGHAIALTGDPAKPKDFNKIASEDELYAWGSLRASYLGQANESLLEQESAGAPGIYPGWAWDQWFYGYTWLPGDGLFYSPFGFGFYSPAFFYGGGYGYGGFRGPYRGGVTVHAEGGFHGGFHGGGGGRR